MVSAGDCSQASLRMFSATDVLWQSTAGKLMRWNHNQPCNTAVYWSPSLRHACFTKTACGHRNVQPLRVGCRVPWLRSPPRVALGFAFLVTTVCDTAEIG